MIDVVFLLLVFFMLASRFGVDEVLPLPLASGGGSYTGPPRLIDVTPGRVLLNGAEVGSIVSAVTPLMEAPTDPLILRGKDGATLQHLVDIAAKLRAAGFTSIVLVE